MSPTRPMMIAAINGPIPYTSVTVVFDASTRRDVASADLLAGGVEGADLVEQLPCGGDPLGRDRPVDVHAGQEFLGSVDGQRPAGATLDQQTQQGVQPADRAGPLGGDLMVAIGQQAQHDPVLVDSPTTTFNAGLRHATIAAERASFGSVLSIRPRSSSRTRADNFGGTSTTCSPARDELLGEHRAHPRRPLDRPRARLEPCRPLQQTGLVDADQRRHASCRSPSRSGRPRPRCGTPCAGRSRS